MNKRIESIAIETLNYLRHNVLSRSDMEDIQVPDVFIEKFAELIVRECAPFIGDKDSQRVHDMLKHFGVK